MRVGADDDAGPGGGQLARGDWQTLKWLSQRVPDFHGRVILNPISLISQWKILDNLRRSLFYPSLLLMLLGAWFVLPGLPGYWTAAGAFVSFSSIP